MAKVWHDRPARSLREEPSFRYACGLLGVAAEDVDEVLADLTWRIAKGADEVPLLAGGPFRMARGDLADGTRLEVLFTIPSDELCCLWWVRKFPARSRHDSTL
jgi:hypothetical protein